MSFANRMKAKLGGHDVGPIPVVVEAPIVPVAVPVANNDNNFIPTKYGEELSYAVKAFLPRAPGTKAAAKQPDAIPDVNSEELFPSLGAPKTKTSMNRGSVAKSVAPTSVAPSAAKSVAPTSVAPSVATSTVATQSWADMTRKNPVDIEYEDDGY